MLSKMTLSTMLRSGTDARMRAQAGTKKDSDGDLASPHSMRKLSTMMSFQLWLVLSQKIQQQFQPDRQAKQSRLPGHTTR